jgi:hypothetical protein
MALSSKDSDGYIKLNCLQQWNFLIINFIAFPRVKTAHGSVSNQTIDIHTYMSMNQTSEILSIHKTLRTRDNSYTFRLAASSTMPLEVLQVVGTNDSISVSTVYHVLLSVVRPLAI